MNNAGIAGGTFPGTGPEHRAADVPLDLLRKVFETNFFAQVSLTETLLPLIRKSPAGRIVNLSSILASLTLHADPKSPIYDAKSFAYDASKSALNAFTIHLAYELRNTNIKVNSAHPGWVKTDMGGDQAPMELSEGGKTSVALATLPDDGLVRYLQRQQRKAGTNGHGGDLLRLTDEQAQRPKPSRDLDPTFATAVIGRVARLVTGGVAS